MNIFGSQNFIQEFDAAARAGDIASWAYSGRLLLPGDDASITVTNSCIIVAIDGVPQPKGHPIHDFLDNHEREIRQVTAEDLGSHREITIAGRWHDDWGQDKSFEPYLTRKVTRDGSAKTAKYNYDFFGRGGDRFGLDLNPSVDGERAFRTMTAATALHTDYSHLRPGLAESVGLPTGVVWYPVIPSALPYLVVEHANKLSGRRSA